MSHARRWGRRLGLGWACAALACVACVVKTADDSGSSGTPGTSETTSGEAASMAVGGRGSTSTQQALAVADSLFDFDPTLDPNATAEANAQAVASYIQTNLKGCGTVNVSGTTVTVSFGDPPGCTLANGMQVSGAATIGLAVASGTVTATVTLTKVVAAGHAIDGTMTMKTSDGSSFQVTMKITADDKQISGDIQVKGATGAFTVDGPATVTSTADGTTSITFHAVHYTMGACYPDSGSMDIVKGKVTQTMTFDANTATTGVVTVTTGRKSSTTTLPAYGSCPGAGNSATKPARDAGVTLDAAPDARAR